MYVEPQRNLFKPFKLNKQYPKNSLIVKEILRSARSVFIASTYECFVNYLFVNGQKSEYDLVPLPNLKL